MRRAVLAIVFCLLPVPFAWSQDLGYPPYGSLEDGQFDAVNRQNLNVHFSIPLVSVPGRGLDFSVAVTHDSLIWKKQYGLWLPLVDATGTPTFGWKTDALLGRTTHVSEMVDCSTKPYVSQHHYGYVFTDAEGTTHPFAIDFYSNACAGPTGPKSGYATDDSGYYLDVSGTDSIVTSPGGLKFTNDSKVTDTNGNFITKVVVSSTQTNWTDTVGRVVLKVIQNADSTDYQYQDTTGAYQTIRLNYFSMPVRTSFGCSGVTEFTLGGNFKFPSSLVLPNGQSYTFTYEPTPGAIGYTTGRLTRVTLPTGGYYDYIPAGVNSGVYCSDGTVIGILRTINDGTTSAGWAFSRAPITGGAWETMVTAPRLSYDSASNTSLFDFDSVGRETQQRHFQGADVYFTQPLVTVDTTYPSTNRYPVSKTTTLADGRVSRVLTTFDSYSLPTQITESGWGNPNPGLALRVTEIAYVRTSAYTSRQMNDLVSSVTVKGCAAGSGCVAEARRDIAYDGSTPTCITGASQHDDTNYGCSFNVRGNPTAITEYADAVNLTGAVTKSMTYDTLGNVRTADVDCCRQKSWAYSSANQYAYPTSETSGPSGGPQLVVATTYNAYTGLVTSVTDANDQTASVAYDSMKRVVSTTRPDSAQTTISYTDSVPPSIYVRTPIDATSARRDVTNFDGLGRPNRWTLKNGDGTASYSAVDTAYDAMSRPFKSTNPYNPNDNPPTLYWSETRFDALGRPVLVIPPDGTPSSNNVSFVYAGVTRTQTDQAGHQRRYDFDGIGRLVTTTEPDPATGVLSWDTTNSYDGSDHIRTISQGVQTRTFVYNGLGQLTSRTTPEAGTDTYTYNSFGLLAQRTDARGVVASYDYDTLNRLTQVSYNVGSTGVPATASISYTYGTSSALNNNGRLITMTDGTGQEAYTFDVVGRPTQVNKTIAGVTYAMTYAYNFADDLVSISYPSGRQVQQAHDAIGRISSLQFNGASVLSGISYNAAQQSTGFGFGNGISATMSYSAARLQLSSLVYSKPGMVLPSFSYGYTQANGGNNGQITQVTDNAAPGRTLSYTFDALNRIGAAETVGSTSDPKWKLTWSYDRYGNRLTQAAALGTPPSSTVAVDPSTNRIVTAGFAYDPSGNTTAYPGATLTPDAAGRTITYSGGASATYAYDGHGLRTTKTTGGTTTAYVFSGTKVVAEYAAGATPESPLREYVYAGDTLVATRDTTTAYHLPDHLSLRATVWSDVNGDHVAETGHYPFGEQWYATNGGSKWLFTSYERDAESGLDYAVARFAGPTLGRFLSADPLAGSIRAPQSLNRFAYVANDPVNAVDPLGRKTACVQTSYWNGTTWVIDGAACIGGARISGGIAGTGWLPSGFDPGISPGGGEGGGQAPCAQSLLVPLDSMAKYTAKPGVRPVFAPDFAAVVSQAIGEMNVAGIVPVVSDGFRTAADQAQRRAGGSGSNPAAQLSLHQAGYAIDFSPNLNANFSGISQFMTSNGTTAGSTFGDPPHFESNPFGDKGSAGSSDRAAYTTKLAAAAKAAENYYTNCNP